MERFLRALGLAGSQLTAGLDERTEVYRSLLEGRNILMLIDDAASESQVLPLLPGGATAAVIVASRGGWPAWLVRFMWMSGSWTSDRR